MEQINFEGRTYLVDRQPGDCPVCHFAIDARLICAIDGRGTTNGLQIRTAFELVYQCPRKDCLRVFVALYETVVERTASMRTAAAKLISIAPSIISSKGHSAEIAKLSPQYVDILTQATAAEAWSLKDVAGCGYRKALEFLVKDYCIAEAPEKANEIRAQLLGRVINSHISDTTIQECARRATWLGNDETHYERRWNDKDVHDLKTLIALTESWINTHLLTQKYLRAMPPQST